MKLSYHRAPIYQFKKSGLVIRVLVEIQQEEKELVSKLCV